MVTLATLYNDFKTLIKQNFYDKEETDDLLDEKQATLVSGTNIKTINNNSLLGSGNISISGSGIVDASLDTSSTNPVQNQAIATEINSLNNSITNLVQIQYIQVSTSSTLNANGGTGTATVTVTPLPTGYRYILFERKGANGRIYNDSLNGSTLTLTAQNFRTSAQKVYMRCYLIYVPTSWSYVERISG